MTAWNNDVQRCTNPETVAGQLTSIRNIYLRQELRTISDQIQAKYQERLPALQLISIASYEQVFNRQPLSLPQDIRREAVKYGLQYYQLNMEKLRAVEVQNGLNRHYDQPLNGDPPAQVQIDNSQGSILRKDENSKYNSDRSSPTNQTNDNTYDSNSTDANNIIASVSPDASPTVPATEPKSQSTSTSANKSDDALSKSTSSESMRRTKPDQLVASEKKLSRKNSPKIVVHRASNSSLLSSSSATTDKKKPTNAQLPSSNKRSDRKKNRSKRDH